MGKELVLEMVKEERPKQASITKESPKGNFNGRWLRNVCVEIVIGFRSAP